KKLVDENKSILEGAVYGWDIHYIKHYTNTLKATEKYFGLEFDLSRPIKEFNQIQHDLFFYGVNDPRFRRHFPDVEPPATINLGRFEGIATNLLRRYGERITDVEYREKMEEYMFTRTCPDCQGTRLKPESRTVTLKAKTIIQLSQMPLTELGVWLQVLPDSL